MLNNHIILQLYSGLKCECKAEKMMEESGLETTPPASPAPPLTVAAAVSSPPMTTGKRWPVKCGFVRIPCSLGLGFLKNYDINTRTSFNTHHVQVFKHITTHHIASQGNFCLNNKKNKIVMLFSVLSLGIDQSINLSIWPPVRPPVMKITAKYYII